MIIFLYNISKQADFDSKSTLDEYMSLDDSIRDLEKASPLKRLELKTYALAQLNEELETKQQELAAKEYALNHIYKSVSQ
jgi:chromosome segregation ATPase